MKNNVKILLLVLLLVSAIGGAAIILYDVETPPINQGRNQPCEPDIDDFPANNFADPDIKRPDDPPVLPDPRTQLTDEDIKTRLGEVELSMAYIRSRVEYKFQTSGRKLAKHWTLEELIRRKEKLDSEHFEWADYSIEYAGSDTASITCSSEKGVKLPTGPLVMELIIGSGRSTYLGYIFPTNKSGQVVLSTELEAELISEVKAEAVAHYCSWIVNQRYSPRYYDYWQPSHFQGVFDWKTDQVVSLSDNTLSITIESIQGRKLARSYSGSFNFKQKNWKSIGTASLFAPLPETADGLEEWLYQYVENVHNRIIETSKLDIQKAQNSACGTWYYSPVALIPGDVKITHKNGETTGTVISSWGRPLPFKGPSSTYSTDNNSEEE